MRQIAALPYTTAADGSYAFGNLTAGVYRVREQQKSGWTQTSVDPADFTALSGSTFGADFGNFKMITISGMKYEDLNGNGSKELNEGGLSGWTIFIDKNLDGQLSLGEQSTTTGPGGQYSFTNLGPGTYTIREVFLGREKVVKGGDSATVGLLLVELVNPPDPFHKGEQELGFTSERFAPLEELPPEELEEENFSYSGIGAGDDPAGREHRGGSRDLKKKK